MGTVTVGLLVGSVGAGVLAGMAWRRGEWLLVALWTTVALTLVYLVSLVLLGLLLVVGLSVVADRWARVAAVIQRWHARSRRKHGVASTLDILRHASWLAVRRRAATVRPSLSELSCAQRLAVRTTQVAAPLCRTGLFRLWSSVEDVILVFGRPRSGKSGWLAGRVIDAPGAVLATSTRTDLYELTADLRARDGRPVSVFNPTGLGDLPSTIAFPPLTGCADPVAAGERASDLLAGGAYTRASGDAERWEGQARRVLTALMHAAALRGLDMHDVAAWVANPEAAARQVMSLLRRSPSASAYLADAEQFLTCNDRTRTSITSSIMPALGWLTNPTVRAATSGGTPFDVEALLAARGTVYLLGRKEAQIAPLLSALTGYLAREAVRLAARQPGGRLDPPLTLVLDEVAGICPVPLDEWTADMGGRGVHIIAALQSRAQLINRWGEAGGRVVLNNAGTVMLFSYGSDTDDLTHWCTLAGERDEPVTTHTPAGEVTSRSARKGAVLSPAQLTTLPPGRVVVFRRGMPVALGWARMAWKRHDIKTATRLARRSAKHVVSAAEQVTQAAHPAPTSPTASPEASPVSVATTQGLTHSPNGTHPAGGTRTQETPHGTP